MKKKIVMILCAAAMCLSLSGCNRQVLDLTYNYNYAIIKLPNGEIVEGKIESWRDYEDGEQIQVKMNDVTYLTSSYNCVLMNK